MPCRQCRLSFGWCSHRPRLCGLPRFVKQLVFVFVLISISWSGVLAFFACISWLVAHDRGVSRYCCLAWSTSSPLRVFLDTWLVLILRGTSVRLERVASPGAGFPVCPKGLLQQRGLSWLIGRRAIPDGARCRASNSTACIDLPHLGISLYSWQWQLCVRD